MRAGDKLKLYFDDSETAVKILVVEPERVAIPVNFETVEEAQTWATEVLLPQVDAVLADGMEGSVESILKAAVGRIVKKSK